MAMTQEQAQVFDEWQDERRRNDSLMLGMMSQIKENLQIVHEQQMAADLRLAAHVAREEDQISAFMSAFPDGPENHRRSHEAMILAASAQERFWAELRLDVAKKGLWGILILAIGLIVAGLGIKLGIPPK